MRSRSNPPLSRLGVPVEMAHEVYEALAPDLPHQLKIYPYGGHSAVWNGQPEQFETNVKAFWEMSQNFTGL